MSPSYRIVVLYCLLMNVIITITHYTFLNVSAVYYCVSWSCLNIE